MNELLLNRAIQRHRAYDLLSTIYAEGITPDVQALCKEIPSIECVLPEVYVADQANAAHQSLFGFNVLPYAGVYLAKDGKLGGIIHHRLNTWYDTMGFAFSRLQTPPDHISTQLAFLSFLADVEIRHSDQVDLVSEIRYKQAAFLNGQVLTWCLPFLFSIKEQDDAIYSEVADLTLALLISHLQECSTEVPEIDSMPEPPDILNDPTTGLKQISEYLVRPVYSGVYFSKDDIKSMARDLQIPTGFGARVQLLSNVFRSAVTFDLRTAFLNALGDHVKVFKDGYNSLLGLGDKRLDRILEEWTRRTQKSLVLLETLERVRISPEEGEVHS